MTAYYPMFASLSGRRCVVVGGDHEAARKVPDLVRCGARVCVIAAEVTGALREHEAWPAVEWVAREYRTGDLRGAWLAIATPEVRDRMGEIWREAEAKQVWLNAMDDVPHCHFIAPSVHRQGDLTVAISTAGRAPVLAVRLRQWLEQTVGPEHGVFVDLLGELREEMARRHPSTPDRTARWYAMVDSDAFEAVRAGDVARARARLWELATAPGADPVAVEAGG